MFIPYGTDAPVYHWPTSTVALIVANTAIFLGTRGLAEESVEPYMLAIGDGVHPIQWLTSLFMHGNFEHLLGNMLVLWVFGIVVEGKVGPFAFLGIYLAIGVMAAVLQQVMFLRHDPTFALGASAAIYGLLAICLIWAPKNEVSVFVLFFFIRIIVKTIEVPIMLFAAAYIGLEVFFVAVQGASLSSELAHSTGAVIGLFVGVALLKADLVDCENWDIFAVMGKRAGRTKRQDAKYRSGGGRVAPSPSERSERKKDRKAGKKPEDDATPYEDPGQAATRRLRHALDQEGSEAAFVAYGKGVRTVAGWKPTNEDWHALIKTLVADKQWRPAITVMEDYLRRADDPSPRVRLTLAQVLIREPKRPAHALRVLAGLPENGLPGPLEATRRKLVRQAEGMIEEGAYELDGDAW